MFFLLIFMYYLLNKYLYLSNISTTYVTIIHCHIALKLCSTYL